MTSVKKPVTMRDYKPKQQPKAKEPKQFPVQIALVLVVDGQPKHNITFDMQGATPQLVAALDARKLAQLVEQVVGPQNASKLWTPGQGKPVVLKAKD